MTLSEAKLLTPGDIIYHKTQTNYNGSSQQWRINGKVKTWKTRPNEVRVPIKRGMYEYDYLTHRNMDQFNTEYGSLVKVGSRENGDGCGIDWFVFKGKVSLDRALTTLGWRDYDLLPIYKGPGKMFRNIPIIFHKGTRTIVYSRRGLDI